MTRFLGPLIILTALFLSCKQDTQMEVDDTNLMPDSLDHGDSIQIGDTMPEDTLPENPIYAPPADLIVLNDAIHFYVFGDFGRNGLDGQSEMAHMMDTVSTVLPPDFIVGTGDNFYPDGVTSTSDAHWTSSFENIYSSANGLNCLWYMTLGNHDYHGSIQAQIDYSDLSGRWTLPSNYYYKDFEKNGTFMRIVFLDTNPFIDPYYSEGKLKDKVILQDTTYRIQWMDSLFSDETKNWKIAVGHHPIYSGDSRTDEMLSIRNHLTSHFDSNGVNIYFNGHEHVIHHAKAEGPTHYITSGTGSKVSAAPSIPETVFAASESAFTIASMTADSIYLQVVSFKGEIIYKTGIK
ncbi:metallophosphoesterase [Marinoscillum sp. MHG1-6]|uniref:metallophosphoesterase n=1 Tax=Marinoscillum sp. MHG1-6 TaxID=2959627 RepID=UPI00215812B5|nr:metallophosphoesterase [Marinoscillum sp. MHG1-6]